MSAWPGIMCPQCHISPCVCAERVAREGAAKEHERETLREAAGAALSASWWLWDDDYSDPAKYGPVLRFAHLASPATILALLAERDRAKAETVTQDETIATLTRNLAAADATVARQGEALRAIRQWDCLNPPDAKLCADFPWLRRLVDAALAGSDVPPAGETT